MKNQPNSQILTIWSFVLILTGAILYFISKGNFIFAGIVVGVIPVLTMAHSPERWWLAAILLANSGLLIPGLGTNLTASLAVSIGFIGLMVMERIFRRTKEIPIGGPQRFAMALTILLVFLASYRGWGLQIFRSTMWGGMQYIQLITGLLFFFYSRQIRVSEKWMYRVAMFYFGFAFLPVIVTLLSRYIPAFSALERIISMQDLGQFDPTEGRVSRIGFLHAPATILGYLTIFLFDKKMKISWQVVFTGAIAIVLAGLSGHRIALVKMGLAAAVYAVLRWRRIPSPVRVKAFAAGIAALILIYAVIPIMPGGFQRMFSVLPGIRVEALAAFDAASTSEWRIEMWRQMISMIPDYLLIGRGLGFDLQEAYGAYTMASDRGTQHAFFIAVHNYHSGPLWAIIDLGGTGALLLFGFMMTVLVRFRKRLHWNYSAASGAIYIVFYAILISHFISFLSVFGYHGDVIKMALVAAVLEVISENARQNWLKEDLGQNEMVDDKPVLQRSVRHSGWRGEV